ncbi:MAG: response regulator [Magnetococcales bacterium]|nr:response regulator [Magnetococcales bacterium]
MYFFYIIKLFWELVSISPIRAETGELTNFIAVKEDITARKHLENNLQSLLKSLDQKVVERTKEYKLAVQEAHRATKSKSEFLANMSHEIRTPMNAIIGMAHLAMQTDLSPKQLDYIEKIHGAANSLLGLINDILDFSKIEAGKLEVESAPFVLSEVLDSVVTLLSDKAREKRLELLIHTDHKIPDGLMGDSLRLRQILTNLTANAVKFTEEGEVLIKAELLDESVDKVKLRFAIIDTGIGMSKEQLARLFQPFSQSDSSTTRRFGGTGLGLSISKQLTELMGGLIQAESKLDKGSQFSVTIAFGVNKDIAPEIKLVDKSYLGARVLVVDDRSIALEIMQGMVEALSFDVLLASSGEEAIETILRMEQEARPVKLILMDWNMPGMDGLETARRIKEDAKIKDVPHIIMVTSLDREEMVRRAGDMELDGFLQKPLTSSMLQDAIAKAFNKNIVSVQAINSSKLGLEAVAQICGAKLLLVEDNPINQQVARELLELAGMHVQIATNGIEAVAAVDGGTFDAVLMDIQMPMMDGYAATMEIRKSITADHLPIIAMTANAMTGDREKCLDAGMNDHLSKPIDPHEMFASLARWIAPKQNGAGIPAALSFSAHYAAQDLPTLPEVDLEQGLFRAGGNLTLYQDLVKRFVRDHGDDAVKIADALSRNDLELAQRLAHSFKGVSGNIGAGSLYNLASSLEAAIRENDTAGLNAIMSQFNKSSHRLFKNIPIFLSRLENMDVLLESTARVAPDEPLLESLQRLAAMIDSDDAEAVHFFQNIVRTTLTNTVPKDKWIGLEVALDEFDYDAASAELERIKATYCLQAVDIN